MVAWHFTEGWPVRLYTAAALSLSLHGIGCGPANYLVEVGNAETLVEQAEADNAKTYAAYEYYAAVSYLEKAKEEAAEGHYEDAVHCAAQAQGLAKRAQRRATNPSHAQEDR